MAAHQQIIDRIFEAQNDNGFWKLLPKTHKYYPDYQHYVPNYRATLWTLILLADLQHDPDDQRIKQPLEAIQDQFFDPEYGIYSLKEDHFPIPCLNGNMIYLDTYFNGHPNEQSLSALAFFAKYQRFDDGKYANEKNEFCANKSCYGKHSCYWGITKLLKGISFISDEFRTDIINSLLDRCIDFVLLHQVYLSSRRPDKVMIPKIDYLTFPNMYKSDFLEILWLLKRENVQSEQLHAAIDLLQSKQQPDGTWLLERKMHNMITSIGGINKPNRYVTRRAKEVMTFFATSSD